tara:strand:+ start:2083 stop:2529 length:447 start_codon:yes stop_codon:yes gene_type:complete
VSRLALLLCSVFDSVSDRSRIFEWPIRVYFEDTDSAGIVYYANYLKFMERARSEWLRSFGIDVGKLVQSEKALFVVRSIQVNYQRPARLSDLLTVTVSLKRIGHASLELWQEVIRRNDTLCSSSLQLACLNADSLRPCRIPKQILEKL